MLLKNRNIATVGQRGWSCKIGSGMERDRSLYWMVLLHRIVISTPHGRGRKSHRRRCFAASKPANEGARTLLFLSRPKNMTREEAQKAKSSGRDRLSNPRIFKRREGVMGTLRVTDEPFTLLMPSKRERSCQSSWRGLGRPHSRLMSLTTLRYLGIEVAETTCQERRIAAQLSRRSRNGVVTH